VRRHIVVLAIIAFGVYYFGFRPNELDKLMKPAAAAPVDIKAQDQFVDPDYSRRPINDRDFAEADRFTVVYYHWDSCPGCKRLDTDIKELLQLRGDVVVRRIALANDWSTNGALRDFGRVIGHTPFVIIYGPDRKVVVKDDGRNSKAFDLLYDWINAEMRRAWEAKNKNKGAPAQTRVAGDATVR
jgi:hypothetical protein